MGCGRCDSASMGRGMVGNSLESMVEDIDIAGVSIVGARLRLQREMDCVMDASEKERDGCE